jgi:acyl-coenzyme A thioesterase PaaI-like protein
MKLGRVLAVGAVELSQEGLSGPVAHASCTYSIPPRA